MNLQRTPLRVLEGRKVRLLRDLQNRGGQVFPKNSIMKIVDKWAGFGLEYPGSRMGYIRCVQAKDFELLDEEEK